MKTFTYKLIIEVDETKVNRKIYENEKEFADSMVSLLEFDDNGDEIELETHGYKVVVNA